LSRSRWDLASLVGHVIDELDDANPDWQFSFEHQGDTSGHWDSDRLSQVFSNLVANAVRHGLREHGVRVSIDGTAPSRVCVQIRNMGVISAAALAKLFEPLALAERQREGSQGLGLGLYISHEIVKAHGGQIHVESDAVQGTMFSVVLPRGSEAVGHAKAQGAGHD
jgi:signal transduction histidine kinase